LWAAILLLPLLEASGILITGVHFEPWMHQLHQDKWSFTTFWSLALNSLLFVTVSLATLPSRGRQEAAQACCPESHRPIRRLSSVNNWRASSAPRPRNNR
jgi:hypothetical protein